MSLPACFAASAAGGGPGDGDGDGDAPMDVGDGDRCAAGTETCRCAGGDVCDAPLTCASGLCVMLPGDGGTGGGSSGDGDGNPNGTSTGDGDGDGVLPPHPIGDFDAAQIMEACDYFIGCGPLIGPTPPTDWCLQSITGACVQCEIEATAGMGNEIDCDAADAALENPSCRVACATLVQSPSDAQDCLRIVSEGGSRVGYSECMCNNCTSQLQRCIDDPAKLCYPIYECCERYGEAGQGCYGVPECMVMIDAAGVTSSSVALATDTMSCASANACTGG